VFINNSESRIGLLKAGVPQGSVLDPLLFLIYINDISDNLSSLVRLFADDTIFFLLLKMTNSVFCGLNFTNHVYLIYLYQNLIFFQFEVG
jgi:hypothetical protein